MSHHYRIFAERTRYYKESVSKDMCAQFVRPVQSQMFDPNIVTPQSPFRHETLVMKTISSNACTYSQLESEESELEDEDSIQDISVIAFESSIPDTEKDCSDIGSSQLDDVAEYIDSFAKTSYQRHKSMRLKLDRPQGPSNVSDLMYQRSVRVCEKLPEVLKESVTLIDHFMKDLEKFYHVNSRTIKTIQDVDDEMCLDTIAIQRRVAEWRRLLSTLREHKSGSQPAIVQMHSNALCRKCMRLSQVQPEQLGEAGIASTRLLMTIEDLLSRQDMQKKALRTMEIVLSQGIPSVQNQASHSPSSSCTETDQEIKRTSSYFELDADERHTEKSQHTQTISPFIYQEQISYLERRVEDMQQQIKNDRMQIAYDKEKQNLRNHEKQKDMDQVHNLSLKVLRSLLLREKMLAREEKHLQLKQNNLSNLEKAFQAQQKFLLECARNIKAWMDEVDSVLHGISSDLQSYPAIAQLRSTFRTLFQRLKVYYRSCDSQSSAVHAFRKGE